MAYRTKKTLHGLLAAGLLSIFGKSPNRVTAKDLDKADFKISTQRLGIRFSEKIRNVFRSKWLRKKGG